MIIFVDVIDETNIFCYRFESRKGEKDNGQQVYKAFVIQQKTKKMIF